MGGKNVVWILGAGFSAPLGGPMLGDLLSLEKKADIDGWRALEGTLATARDKDTVDQLYFLYHYGRRFEGAEELRNSMSNGERLWANAEEFLDLIDSPSAAFTRRVAGILGHRRVGYPVTPIPSPEVVLKDVRTAARRRVAAECCHFLDDANTDTERWQPYQRWGEALDRDDTIITFNYDRTIEMLCQSPETKCLRLQGVVTIAADFDDSRRSGANLVKVLKLHGSVDWKQENGKIRRMENAFFAALANDDESLIATPGANKRTMSTTVLSPLWLEAIMAIRSADSIVFIGYRFPETDAQAREVLLDAVKSNRPPNNHLRLHIVLGPKRSDDVERLEHLLRYQCRRAGRLEIDTTATLFPAPEKGTFSIHVHPLWSQDFLSVFDHSEL